MSKTQRVRNIFFGLLIIFCSFLMAIFPKVGFPAAIMILCMTLIVLGLRYIIYYFRMARHMVGGKSLLFLGIVILDIGLVTITMNDLPLAYVMLYLIVAYAFSGVIDILRALEAKREEAPSWKMNLSTGIINVLLAIFALIGGIFFKSIEIVTAIYCVGLFYSGIMRIVSAFRKSSIVYIA